MTDSANTTDSNSTSANLPGNSASKKTTVTPIIVGVVVGVGGGLLLLLSLVLCLHRRRKQQKLLPEPYPNAPFQEREAKSKFTQPDPVADEQRNADRPSSDRAHLAEHNTEEPWHEPVRRIVREQDAEGIIEYLPPEYMEIWRGARAPEPEPSPSAISDHSSDIPMRTSTQPGRDPSLDDKVKVANTDRPLLKQEYARTFGRALPKPPRSTSAHASGDEIQQQSAQLTGQPSQGSLKVGYKRLFAPSTKASREGEAVTPDESGKSSGDDV